MVQTINVEFVYLFILLLNLTRNSLRNNEALCCVVSLTGGVALGDTTSAKYFKANLKMIFFPEGQSCYVNNEDTLHIHKEVEAINNTCTLTNISKTAEGLDTLNK